MIVATNLTKRFGRVVAVDSISFRIGRGRVVGFLGPNGAGKTTTIRMIAGFLPPTSGTVTISGHDVQRAPLPARRRIGYLPEATPLYTEMRVRDYLRFRARLYQIPREQQQTAVDRAIDRCWVREVQKRPIGQLSKGFRQRVGLAAALIHEPPVLILDEPTVGLDPAQIREMRSLIRELAGRHTVLLSTHILPEAELTCDEIMMIANGRIQAEGTIEDLRAKAAHGSHYVVETDATDPEAALGSLSGVATTQSERIDDRWWRVRVLPVGTTDVGEDISRKLAANGAAVRALYRDAPSLEEMFLQRLASQRENVPDAESPAADEPVAEDDPDAEAIAALAAGPPPDEREAVAAESHGEKET